MKTVSRFEASLLRILHGLLGRVSTDQLLKLVQAESDCPNCLSRNAVELVQDALRKGVPLYLARLDGWKRDRFIRQELIAEGRLWNRTPPDQLGLSFSRHSLQLLLWLTANHPQRPFQKLTAEESEFTVGDRLLYYLAFESLRKTGVAAGLLAHPPFQRQSLIWLSSLTQVLLHFEEPSLPNWDFSPWMTGAGASILETLQSRLAARWLEIEREKNQINQPEAMRRLGQVQHQLLTVFFDTAERAGRRDLCRFFLRAMKNYVREVGPSAGRGPSARLYNLNLQGLRIAERSEVYQSATACLRHLSRMDRWNRLAQSIGFYDEGYAAAQLWKSDWEQLEGDRLCAESQTLVNAFEPLAIGGGSTTGTAGETHPPESATTN